MDNGSDRTVGAIVSYLIYKIYVFAMIHCSQYSHYREKSISIESYLVCKIANYGHKTVQPKCLQFIICTIAPISVFYSHFPPSSHCAFLSWAIEALLATILTSSSTFQLYKRYSNGVFLNFFSTSLKFVIVLFLSAEVVAAIENVSLTVLIVRFSMGPHPKKRKILIHSSALSLRYNFS